MTTTGSPGVRTGGTKREYAGMLAACVMQRLVNGRVGGGRFRRAGAVSGASAVDSLVVVDAPVEGDEKAARSSEVPQKSVRFPLLRVAFGR